jgi:hypothetical protein
MAEKTGIAGSASPGRITGVGGVFLKSRDPRALGAWYRDVLGLQLESWGGALLRHDAPQHPPVLAWNVFDQSADYFEPSKCEVMINYAVDDLGRRQRPARQIRLDTRSRRQQDRAVGTDSLKRGPAPASV